MEENYEDDNDEEFFEGLYTDGHWEWDNKDNQLVFISDRIITAEVEAPVTINFGSVEFKEDIDLIEQDIKDVVLFTAPRLLIKPSIINFLHLQTTERFLRALILYCQYYLQIANKMSIRITDGVTKIRTPNSEKIEAEYRENLEDLRLLIVKDYIVVIMGDGDYAKYHHMGASKRLPSLLKRGSVLFELLIRFSIQIVWIALGRKSFNQIELEVHRIFKSDEYNLVEHKLKEKIPMTSLERSVLRGQCLRTQQKMIKQSPLIDEIFCKRPVDYRIFGLGVFQYTQLNTRLHYMAQILQEPETKFRKLKLNLGILGMPRDHFDIMLRQVKVDTSSTSSTRRQRSTTSRGSIKLKSQESRKSSAAALPLYPPVLIPRKISELDLQIEEFPKHSVPCKPSDDSQRRMWLRRIAHKTGRKQRPF